MAEDTSTRAKVADKVYITKSGEESRHASPDSERLEIRFTGGEIVTVTLDAIGKNVRKACAWHGLSQKLGDAYAGKSGDEALENVQAVLERLQADDWVKARESAGPRISQLVEAVVAVLTKAGKKIDDAARSKIAELLKDKSARATALADPNVKAAYSAIQAAAAATRAEAAAAKAKAAPASDISKLFA